MKLSFYMIDPSGNMTVIVETPVIRESQSRIANMLMSRYPQAEQVAFEEPPVHAGSDLAIRMMGGEFCGNAALSAAALFMHRGGIPEKTSLRLEVSGAEKPLEAVIGQCGGIYSGTVEMPLPLSCSERELFCGGRAYRYPVVEFAGISHVIVAGGLSERDAEDCIRDWCAFLKADALGIIFREGDSIRPFVYVASTDTAVWERSCASGTCAVAAFEAASSRESTAIRLGQPGGILGAEAGYDGGIISLRLNNTARIVGHFEIET